MGNKALLVVALSGLIGGQAVAQEGPEPPPLELPMGMRVRLQTRSGPEWIRGVLAQANKGAISLVPEGASPLGARQLRLPGDEVTRLEVLTGKKRQWLVGLVIGAALGLAIGATNEVDAETCEFDEDVFCSRGSAVVAMGGTMAGLGALVGALVKKDVWAPVALDALGPPRKALPEPGLTLQVVPGGLRVAASVRF